MNISALGYLSINNVPSTGSTILGISSSFLDRRQLSKPLSASADRVMKSVRNAVYVIQKALMSSMLPGSAEVTLTSPNIRIAAYYNSIQSTTSSVLTPPTTSLESMFSASLPSLTLSSQVPFHFNVYCFEFFLRSILKFLVGCRYNTCIAIFLNYKRILF